MIRWSLFYFLLYAYRCWLSYAGESIGRALTKLGDAGEYQRDSFVDLSLGALTESTRLTSTIGALFGEVVRRDPILVNIQFQTLAFVGIVAFLQALSPRDRRWAALLVLFPSFNLWTSIASKEAVVVLGLGLMCAYLVHLFREDRIPLNLPLILGVYILAVYKPHYLIAIALVAISAVAGRYVRQYTTVLLVGLLISLAPIYLFRAQISAESLRVVPHFFDPGGRSTRSEIFFNGPADVFARAPEGMVLAFLGPTPAEALSGGILHFAAFVESLVLVGVLTALLLVRIPRVPVFNFLLWLFALFWILFPNYPFGVANPGSAVRYRAGWLLFVFFLFTFLLSREAYVRLRRGDARPPPSGARIAVAAE